MKADSVKAVKRERFNPTIFFKQFLAAPMIIFLLFFAVLPLLLIFVYAFMDKDGGFTPAHFVSFFTSGDYKVLWRSIWIALVTTAICLAIGYPVAYILALTKIKRSAMILMLFVVPMWVNSLLRTIAMKDMLQFFMAQMNLGTQMNTWTLLFGLVNDFLPFCILPLYTVLSKMDKSYAEAAQDLGARPVRVFFNIIFPLSISGVISAALMVFMPTVSTFYLNEFLGPTGEGTLLFGQLIEKMFLGGSDNFNAGSMLALITLVLVAVSVFVTNKFAKVGNARGGLW